jgi:branched-chain amino acid transport system permease protein
LALAGAAGAALAWLGFRFSVRGVHFALLTIAFAELARVLFDNWALTGGSGGLFLPARDAAASAIATWRGGAMFFYFFTLGLCAAATLLAALLARRRTGYVWRALKADEDAARALGVRALPNKVAAVALSAALTALGGSVYALMNGSIFPDSAMGMRMSIDIIIGPIIGGLGTAFGPLVGAAFVLPLADAAAHLGQAAGLAGLNILVYGVVLILVIRFLPHGIGPAIAALLRRVVR